MTETIESLKNESLSLLQRLIAIPSFSKEESGDG
jgi:hypothetical protein